MHTIECIQYKYFSYQQFPIHSATKVILCTDNYSKCVVYTCNDLGSVPPSKMIGNHYRRVGNAEKTVYSFAWRRANIYYGQSNKLMGMAELGGDIFTNEICRRYS